jgi:Polyketide cyclase / dehydrase and lipid transport
MGYGYFVNERPLKADRATIWSYLVEPDKLANSEDHPVEIQSSKQVCDQVGDHWTEVHGAECDHDRVRWTVVACKAPLEYSIEGKQRGVRQRVTYLIAPGDGETAVVERIDFSLSLAGRFPQQILPWLLLGTGVLAKVGKGMSDTLDRLAGLTNEVDAVAPPEA